MKKRKGRSVRKAKNLHCGEPDELVKAPHSFVINRGTLGKNASELLRSFRRIMEPYTASHLKVQKSNVIKDFVHSAGALNVTHLIIFSKSDSALYLRIIKLPRGPTITYKINEYSLVRDIISSQKKSMMYAKLFEHHPLLVLNDFSGEGMQLHLMATMFQNMFPSININKTKLNDIRRCLLLHHNEDKTIEFRHYAIKIVPTGISKAVKKLIQKKVPNLSQFKNLDEFMENSGNLSESEAELDTAANTVILPQPITSRGNIVSQRSAIRLYEIGPRMKLELVKIEEGLMGGDVLYHAFIHKTPEEIKALKKKIEAKRLLKARRRAEQNKNVERKKKLAEAQKKGNKEEENNSEEERNEDIEWYRKEVGEEPDESMLGFGKRKKTTTAKEKSTKKRKITTDKKSIEKRNTRFPGKAGKVSKMQTKKDKVADVKSKENNSNVTPKKEQTIQEFLIKRKKRKEAKLAKKKGKKTYNNVLTMKAKHSKPTKGSKPKKTK